eukprot:3815-Pelagococcus_subviridis.AAC.5
MSFNSDRRNCACASSPTLAARCAHFSTPSLHADKSSRLPSTTRASVSVIRNNVAVTSAHSTAPTATI